MTKFSTVMVLLALVGAALGDDTTAARAHYQKGLAAYQSADYQLAIRELKLAYQLKPLPTLLINLGTTYRKMGDRAEAARFFAQYLDEAPADAPDRAEVSQWLESLHPLKEDGALVHSVIESAPPDAPVDVRAKMQDAKLFLFYRQSGASDFTKVPMMAHGPENIGRVPAASLTGVAMEYYIEARDSGDQVIQTSGSPKKPNVVLVDPSAPSQELVAMAETRRPARDQARDDAAREDSDDERPREPARLREMDDEAAPLAARPKTAPRKRLGGAFYSGLVLTMVGAGGLALGIAGDVIARQQSMGLTQDSQHNPPYQFSDPNAKGLDDAAIESRGALWNKIGIASTVGGSALLATGLILMIYDAARHRGEAAPKRVAGIQF